MHSHRHLFIITGIAIILLFIKLGAVTVFQVAEARNSEVAAEMLETKEFIVPYFNGEIRTDKPALPYYAMLAAYKIGGIHEAGARFFSALCGLLVIIATYFFTKRNAGAQAAWWTCLVLLSSLHAVFQFRLATPDPYLVACHVLSLFCFWEGFKTNKKAFFFLMYLLFGFALLAKGPVGILLPLATIFFYALFSGNFNWKMLRSLQPWWGILIVALIAMPWFYLVDARTHGEWTNGFFMEHNVGRFSKPVDGHGGSFLLTLLFIVAGMFPFSFFMPRSIVFAWRHRKQYSWLLFNLLAAGCIIIPYAFSATKLINYTTPAYPFLAIITGVFISHCIGIKTRQRKLLPEWAILTVVALVLPVALYYWMKQEAILYPIRGLSVLMLLLPVAVMAGCYHYYTYQTYRSFLLVALGAIAQSILFFIIMYPALDKQGAVYKQKSRIASAKTVIAYRNFNHAFTFYHKMPVMIMPSAAAVSGFLKQHPEALVLEREKQPRLKDSLPAVEVLASDKELFSRHYSTIYRLKTNP